MKFKKTAMSAALEEMLAFPEEQVEPLTEEEVKVFDRIQVILSECSLFQPFVGWGDDEEHTKVDHKAVCYMKNQGFDVLVHIETEDEDDEFEDAYAQVYVSLGDAVIRL
jgi:hypothetical protein